MVYVLLMHACMCRYGNTAGDGSGAYACTGCRCASAGATAAGGAPQPQQPVHGCPSCTPSWNPPAESAVAAESEYGTRPACGAPTLALVLREPPAASAHQCTAHARPRQRVTAARPPGAFPPSLAPSFLVCATCACVKKCCVWLGRQQQAPLQSEPPLMQNDAVLLCETQGAHAPGCSPARPFTNTVAPFTQGSALQVAFWPPLGQPVTVLPSGGMATSAGAGALHADAQV